MATTWTVDFFMCPEQCFKVSVDTEIGKLLLKEVGKSLLS
jgi:hypothetical protein